jgi:phosphatidylglycerol:prolipoprotein diacylglycerol transferase
VQPTQLYETAIMLVAFAVLWRLRDRARPVGWLFGLYLVFAGAERFAVEFLRAKDDRLLGPFTIAQLTSVILIGLGAWLLALWREGPSPAAGGYLEGGKGSLASKK